MGRTTRSSQKKRKVKEKEDDNPREKLPQKKITTRCAETDLMEVGERRRRPSERQRSARLQHDTKPATERSFGQSARFYGSEPTNYLLIFSLVFRVP